MQELFQKSLRTLELPTVLKLLEQEAVCESAKEACIKLTPTDILTEAAQRLRETSDAKRMVAAKGTAPLCAIKQVSGSLARARLGGMLNTRELLEIAAVLRAARQLKLWGGDSAASLTGLFSALMPNKYLEEKITLSIAGEDEIADAASSELADIRRHIRAANSKIRDILNHIISSPAYSKVLQDTIITQRSGRFVVPVKAENKSAINGLVHDVSSSGQTLFIEPMQVVQANNEIRELQAKEKKEIERILMELSAEAASFENDILCDYECMVKLDIIFAKSELSYKMKANEPILSSDCVIDLKRVRHPLLSMEKAVPISVRLGGEYDTLVITGPNTGGKTVTLKTIGLCCLMAACGLHIPAESGSCVPILNGVMADIGDEQSIEQSLSTFSSHMTNIVGMLEYTEGNTLILFDELGAGTDPAEGAALAVSIIEYARNRGALIAATTHYAELKVYATSTPGVMNASCEFDVETLRPTYRLLLGIPGKSNAFEISRRLGLGEDIITDAKGRMKNEQADFERVLALLQSERQTLERMKEETAQLRANAEKDSAEAAELLKKAEAEKEKAGISAKREADRLLREVRRITEETFEELDEMRKKAEQKDGIRQLNDAKAELKRRLNDAQDKLGSREEDEAEVVSAPVRPIRAGDTVVLRKIGTTATVLSVSADGTLNLQAGILRITAKPNEVRLSAGSEPEKKKFLERTEAKLRNLSVSSEIDLRGTTSEEAMLMLERYLDSASLAKLPTVRIIHGKGTGVLRKSVQDYLRKTKTVTKFRLGRYGEGEDGVTIAELNL